MIAVEVRRGTLNSQDRGGGPARNTDLTGSRLRSDTEHCRGGGGDGPTQNTDEEQEEEERDAAHIKSNNPHLTSREKKEQDLNISFLFSFKIWGHR